MDCSTPGFPVHHHSQSLLKRMSIESMMPSNHLILWHLLLLLHSIFPSIKVFSKESVLHIRWPKYWRFSFSISPSNEYSGLISFRIDWFYLLAVQGAPKSLLQHHSSVQCSEVAQSSPTLCDPMNCSLPCSSVYGIFLARVLEWVAIFFSRHHSSKTSILRCSIFFMVQLSHP